MSRLKMSNPYFLIFLQKCLLFLLCIYVISSETSESTSSNIFNFTQVILQMKHPRATLIQPRYRG